MSNVPTDFKYTQTHEWVKQNADGSVTVGITDHAQQLLGDLVFVELPALERVLTAGQESGSVVESVKAASDVYAPVSGVVTAVNENLSAEPQLVNQDPYGKGWLFQVQLSQPNELNSLLDADSYTKQLSVDSI